MFEKCAARLESGREWRKSLHYGLRFKDAAFEKEFQQHFKETHTVRVLRVPLLGVLVVWTLFVIETLVGKADQTVIITMVVVRLSLSVVGFPYLFFSYCTRLADRSMFESALPGQVIMGLTVALQVGLFHNVESYSVPLGITIIIVFSTYICRMSPVQTILMDVMYVVSYLVAFYISQPYFEAGVPVAFSLLASSLMAVAASLDINLRDRHFFWLMKHGNVDPEDYAKVVLLIHLYDHDEEEHARATKRLESSAFDIVAPVIPHNATLMHITPLAPNLTSNAVPVSTAPTPSSATASTGDRAPPAASPRRPPALRRGLTMQAHVMHHESAQMHRITNRFNNPRLEQRFAAWMASEVYDATFRSLVVMAVGEALFGISDYFAYPDGLRTLFLIRYCGTVPICLIAAALCWSRAFQRNIAQALPIINLLLGATKFVTILTLPFGLPLNVTRAYSGAFMRFLIHAFSSFRLRPLGVLGSCLPWLIGVTVMQVLDKQAAVENLFLWATLLLIVITSHVSERQYRLLFLMETLMNTRAASHKRRNTMASLGSLPSLHHSDSQSSVGPSDGTPTPPPSYETVTQNGATRRTSLAVEELS